MERAISEEELYRELRPLLVSIAYRMVGGVADAEDIVQEAFLRFRRALGEGTQIEVPKAYLVSITTRLAIDHLRSARVRRESYVGPWLPEPLVTDGDPEELAEMADSLSTAFLVLLERLSPVERAVYLLRDVFGFDYSEIAGIVGKTEQACRQILVRARRHLDEGRPRFTAGGEDHQVLVSRFLAACDEGDVDGLVRLLAEDVTFYGDGGGKALAAPRPIHGRERVGPFLAALLTRAERLNLRLRPARINGGLGALVVDADGGLLNALTFDVSEGTITTIWAVANPDKLRHLGPVSDLASG